MWPCTKSDEFCCFFFLNIFSERTIRRGVVKGCLENFKKYSNLVRNLVSNQHLHGRLMKILGKAFSARLADLARNGQEAPW